MKALADRANLFADDANAWPNMALPEDDRQLTRCEVLPANAIHRRGCGDRTEILRGVRNGLSSRYTDAGAVTVGVAAMNSRIVSLTSTPASSMR